ncbi:hypothetical protein L686_13375 [Stutzerimonas stutzeri MF28]|nr:hypothetical protein L686_13375 [Stutzerimonas stutzeri MF28]
MEPLGQFCSVGRLQRTIAQFRLWHVLFETGFESGSAMAWQAIEAKTRR